MYVIKYMDDFCVKTSQKVISYFDKPVGSTYGIFTCIYIRCFMVNHVGKHSSLADPLWDLSVLSP